MKKTILLVGALLVVASLSVSAQVVTASKKSTKGATGTGTVAATGTGSEVAVSETDRVSKVIIEVGAITLNPISVAITPATATAAATATLQKDSSSAKAFARVAYEDKWAFNPARVAEKEVRDGDFLSLSDRKKLLVAPRFDFRASLAFFSDADSDNSTATAVVGNSDFAFEVEQDLTFIRSQSVSGNERKSLGVGVAYAAVTDSESFDIHNRVLVGPAFNTAWNLNPGKRPGRLSLRAGIAWIDTVNLIGGDPNQVRLAPGGTTPEYELDEAFGVEMAYSLPAGKNANLMLGSSFYVRKDIPNNWSAFVSLQVSTDKLLGFVGLGSGGDEE